MKQAIFHGLVGRVMNGRVGQDCVASAGPPLLLSFSIMVGRRSLALACPTLLGQGDSGQGKMRHVAGGRAHELRDDGPAPPVRKTSACAVAGELLDQLPHGPDGAPEQPGPHRGDGCSAQGGRRLGQFGHVDLRQEIGEFVQARADMAMPGRIAPPRKAPPASTRSTVMADPASTTTAGRPGVRRRLAARASSKPIDADHVGPRQLDHQRQIARGQQHDFIVRAMIAEPVDQPRRSRAVDAAEVPAERAPHPGPLPPCRLRQAGRGTCSQASS